MYRHLLQRRAFAVLLLIVSFSWWVGIADAADSDSDADADIASLQGQEWITSCREKGFDPFTLGCQTCALLPTINKHNDNIRSICQQCCQPYKDTQSLRKPYKSAVILIPTSSQSMEPELEQFLQQDWTELVQKQGFGKTKLQKLDLAGNKSQQHGFWFVRTPAELLFLDETLPTDKQMTEKQARKKAKEVITLYGWKREDIKDMIETLLA